MASTQIVDWSVFCYDESGESLVKMMKIARDNGVGVEIVTWNAGNGIEGLRFKGKKSDIINFAFECNSVYGELMNREELRHYLFN